MHVHVYRHVCMYIHGCVYLIVWLEFFTVPCLLMYTHCSSCWSHDIVPQVCHLTALILYHSLSSPSIPFNSQLCSCLILPIKTMLTAKWWWCTLLIPALRRQRWVDLCEFKASL
ncbi:rCG45794, partial [Rattus norvegicus]